MTLLDATEDGEPPREGNAYREVFEHFPFGVLLADGEGNIREGNGAARKTFGDRLDAEVLRCCDLFGCRRDGTPLAGDCLSALARTRSGPLPEVRVEVHGQGDAAVGAWVVASAIGSLDGTIVFQVRPGIAGDRRRVSDPHWLRGPKLRIFTFGRTRLESGEAPLSGDWLSHRPGELLKYLAVERGRVVQVDELLEVFWVGTVRAGASNVRQAIHTLRDRLEPQRTRHKQSSFVLAIRGGYELDRERVWIDADDFESSARKGLDLVGRGDGEAAEPSLLRAASLYQGDFMEDEPYAEWAIAERERLRDLAAHVLRAVADLRLRRGDADGGLEALSRLAEVEPFDDRAHRDLIGLLLRQGRHAEAQRRYDVLRRRFRRAFGTEPDFVLADVAGRRVYG